MWVAYDVGGFAEIKLKLTNGSSVFLLFGTGLNLKNCLSDCVIHTVSAPPAFGSTYYFLGDFVLWATCHLPGRMSFTVIPRPFMPTPVSPLVLY